MKKIYCIVITVTEGYVVVMTFILGTLVLLCNCKAFKCQKASINLKVP
jgi:hypothetical protein